MTHDPGMTTRKEHPALFRAAWVAAAVLAAALQALAAYASISASAAEAGRDTLPEAASHEPAEQARSAPSAVLVRHRLAVHSSES